MTSHFYITTPIYYVNDVPHIGTAYTSIAADVLARFMRLDGRHVKFLTGTDEHGQKVEKAALKRGMLPQTFVDEVSEHFRRMGKLLHLTNDVFMRTTESRHKKSAQALWKKIADAGYIYKGVYQGWYCVRDEAYYQESELINGKAPTGADVEWVEESSYFFKLSAFQDKLLHFYETNPGAIAPLSRKNEVLSFIRGGLKDLSISRSSFSWGIPVPGDESHVMYVWIEALSNYITALGYPEMSGEMETFWPEVHHLMGKDIIRFHAVYWHAFLMAADIKPPKRVFAHGWWTNEGQKISKSLGNTIDPHELVQEFGLDQVRYYLMREVTFGSDGDFSKKTLINRINSDLANDYGNLAQRVLSFAFKNCEGKIPTAHTFTPEDKELLGLAHDMVNKIRSQVEQQAINKICEIIWEVITEANRYVDIQQPWSLRKTDTVRMHTVLYVLMETIRHLGILTQPLVPLASEKILNQLNIPIHQRDMKALTNTPLISGVNIIQPEGVFPRISAEGL